MTSPSPTPGKRAAKRLPRPPAPPRAVVELAELVQRHLTELAEVHRESAVVRPGMCIECLTPWPCHTRVMIDEALEAVRS